MAFWQFKPDISGQNSQKTAATGGFRLSDCMPCGTGHPVRMTTAPPQTRQADKMGGAGFEPAKAEPTDLQSVPFDRFGIPPHIPPCRTARRPAAKLYTIGFTIPPTRFVGKSQRRESNPRPADYKSAALPTELRWRNLPATNIKTCHFTAIRNDTLSACWFAAGRLDRENQVDRLRTASTTTAPTASIPAQPLRYHVPSGTLSPAGDTIRLTGRVSRRPYSVRSRFLLKLAQDLLKSLHFPEVV